jgi:S-adenosylmethionine hydrolase
VAAHLAAGVEPAEFGPLIGDPVRSAFAQTTPLTPDRWSGAVLKIDRFGNVITNFRPRDFPELTGRPYGLFAGGRRIERLVRAYADGAPGELVLVEGSSGFIEAASNQESAASLLGIGAGAPVELYLI